MCFTPIYFSLAALPVYWTLVVRRREMRWIAHIKNFMVMPMPITTACIRIIPTSELNTGRPTGQSVPPHRATRSLLLLLQARVTFETE